MFIHFLFIHLYKKKNIWHGSVPNPLRDNERKHRRSVRREEHDRRYLRGRAPRLRNQEEGKSTRFEKY